MVSAPSTDAITSLRPALAEGLRALGLELSDTDQGRLLDYLTLLAKWSQTYNLTAIREPARMLTHHLLDSLAIAPWLHGRRVLDVGSGAGLPGIPLAVARPDMQFVLLDSNAKKVRFMRQAVAELGLANVQVVHCRVEQYRPEEKFDTLVSRAFAAIADMLAGAGHLGAIGGRILAMKGLVPEAELAALPAGYRVLAVEPLQVPGLGAARHVVVMQPAASTNKHTI